MTRLEIKEKVMQDALGGKIDYPAKILAYIDCFYALSENPNIDTYVSKDPDLYIAYEYVNQNPFQKADAITMKMYANNLPDQAFAYVSVERSDQVGQCYQMADYIANGEVKNVLNILITPDVGQSKYFVYWVPKDISDKSGGSFFRRYEVTIGEGWGKLEGTEKALTTKVDKKLYNLWKKNIVGIEKKKQEVLEQYILSQKNNEDKKQEAS